MKSSWIVTVALLSSLNLAACGGKSDTEKAAEQVQKKLPELGPKGLNILYDLYEKANRFEDALNLVTPMLERDPNNIGLLNAKGRLLMRLGRFADAKACLQKSDELAPQNIERQSDRFLEADKSANRRRNPQRTTAIAAMTQGHRARRHQSRRECLHSNLFCPLDYRLFYLGHRLHRRSHLSQHRRLRRHQ